VRLSEALDADLDLVCTNAGSRYLELGLELGFQEQEIDNVKEDWKYCQDITRELLKSWIQRNEDKATWEALGDALCEIEVGVDFIYDVLERI